MGRPRKWASDAERMAAKRCSDIPVNEQSKRTPDEPPSKRTHKRTGIEWHPEISQDRFKGVGRGIPIQADSKTDSESGYVLVSLRSEPNGDTQNAVVSEQAWRERLETRCTHGLAGWACKQCL